MADHPALLRLEESGEGLDFNYWDVNTMDDTTLVAMIRLMARGLEREESEDCPAALSGGGDPNALFLVILDGVTDSAEAEEWGDMLERAIIGMAQGNQPGEIAAGEVLEARMIAVLGNLSEQEMAVLEAADDDPGGAACMIVRIMFQDLAREKIEIAGPLIRGMMAAGTQQGEAEP